MKDLGYSTYFWSSAYKDWDDKLTKEEAIKTAMTLWKEINWLNLKQNILPTRERASLILTKSANHAVEEVRLRK